MTRFIRVLFVAVALIAMNGYAQQTLPKGVSKVTEVEGITEYRLDNGLKVLLFPDPSKPTLTVNITYLVGSRHENYGETGMAHLLEHLVFKGTPKNPQIDKAFNERGARANGTTWLDRTNYYEQLQASDDNLRWALQLEADRMVNSFIAKKDLDSEMTVVRNEYEAGENNPVQVMLKRMQSVAYDWHSYGRSTIGNRSDIENVRIENLQAFYRLYYQPDNAILLVAGKFDEAKALAWIGEYFGAIPKPKRELPPLWTVEPTQDGERTFTVRRKGDIQIVALGYKVPSGLHPHSDAVGFANDILAGVPSGRLHKALVETGKAQQIIGFPLTGVNPGLHLIAAIVKKGDAVEPVRDEMIRLVEEFHKNGPTPAEMERTRKDFENQFEKTLNDHERIGIALSEYIALGDWRLFFQSRDDVAKVTAADVTGVAGRYYRRDNRVVGLFVPEDQPMRAEIPAAPAVAEVMKDFKPRAATSTAEAFDPSQDNIMKRTRLAQAGGAKLALLPKKTRGETVNVQIRLNYGDEKTLFGQSTVRQLTGAMLPRGSAKLSRTQIDDEMKRLKMEGSLFAFQTTRANLAEALKLAQHVMKEPAFPASEFEQLKKQTLTNIEAQKSEPQARAQERIGQHFNIYPKGDVRYAPSLDEQIALVSAVKLDDLKAFHRDFFGASSAEIAIVGDFDPPATEKLLNDLFGDWKSKRPYARVEAEHKDVPSINELVNTPDKENGVFVARLNLSMRDDDPDYPALFLVNYMMGGGAGLNSRLAERIRNKDGLSYGVGSQLQVSSASRGSAWTVFAIAAPQNIAKVEAAMKDELARALRDGFSTEEVERAKSGALQQRVQQRSQDNVLAAGWVGNLNLGRTFEFSKQIDEKLKALTKTDVDAVLRKYIAPDKLSIVKAADQSKIK